MDVSRLSIPSFALLLRALITLVIPIGQYWALVKLLHAAESRDSS